MAQHIPTVDIRRLGDISFARQLEQALLPNPEYDADHWLFVPNTYTEYRYILGTRGKIPSSASASTPPRPGPGLWIPP